MKTYKKLKSKAKKRIANISHDESAWNAWKKGGGLFDFMSFVLCFKTTEMVAILAGIIILGSHYPWIKETVVGWLK